MFKTIHFSSLLFTTKRLFNTSVSDSKTICDNILNLVVRLPFEKQAVPSIGKDGVDATKISSYGEISLVELLTRLNIANEPVPVYAGDLANIIKSNSLFNSIENTLNAFEEISEITTSNPQDFENLDQTMSFNAFVADFHVIVRKLQALNIAIPNNLRNHFPVTFLLNDVSTTSMVLDLLTWFDSIKQLSEHAIMRIIRLFKNNRKIEKGVIFANILKTPGLNSSTINYLTSEILDPSSIQDYNEKEYGVIIKSFCKIGDLKNTVSVFEIMKNKFKPSIENYNSIIHGFRKNKKFDDALEWYRKMMDAGFSPNNFTCSSLIGIYTLNGQISEIPRLLDDMRNNGVAMNQVLYGNIIKLFCNLDIKYAKKLFNHMQTIDVLPNAFICNMLILEYCKIKRLDEAKSIHGFMVEHNISVDIITINSLIFIRFKAGDVEGAVSLFKNLPEMGLYPTVKTFNIIIAEYCRLKNVNQANKWFSNLSEYNLQPNIHTINTLMGGYSKRDLNTVIELYNKLPVYNLKPNMTTINTIIDAHCKNHDLKNALVWMNRFEEFGFKPDLFSFNLIINAYCKFGDTAEAVAWFESLPQYNLSPDIVTINPIIGAYCKKRNVELVQVWCQKIKEFNLKPSLYTFSLVMNLHANAGKHAEVMKWFLDLQKMDLKPDMFIYSIVVKSHLKAGRPADAISVLTDIVNNLQRLPSMFCTSVIFEYCERRNLWEMVAEVSSKMQQWKSLGYKE